MAKPFNINQTSDYILKEDRKLPMDQQTVFLLGGVDSALHSYLWDSNVSYSRDVNAAEEAEVNPTPSAKVEIRAFSKIRDTVKFGLKGWRNFGDVEFSEKAHMIHYGAPVPQLNGKPRQGLSDRALDLLLPYLSELAAAIESANKLTPEETKNFVTPSVAS